MNLLRRMQMNRRGAENGKDAVTQIYLIYYFMVG